MSKKEAIKTVEISLTDIVPDENQPRKFFEPTLMRQLKDSVRRFGIMTPLTLEKVGDKYLIENGERRFRVAKELKLDTVPAIIQPAINSIERLIRQFHIQQHHAEWEPAEKALTVYKICEELGINMEQAADMLGIDQHVVRRLNAFAKIIDKKSFAKHKIQIEYAERIISLKSVVRRVMENELEQEFDRAIEKKLEENVISRIVLGEIRKPFQVTKLKDAFIKEPKSIKEFLETKISPDALFIKTKAKGAYHLRNAVNAANFAKGHIISFLKTGDVKLTATQITQLKGARETITELINKAE